MSTPDPTHYDLLGLRRDANSAQIRKAWRKRTAKAGPGSPEFLRLNEAAETLLDPHRRSSYDASHPEHPEPEPEAAAAADPGTTAAAGEKRRRGLGWWTTMAVLPLVTVLVLAGAVYLTLQHRHDNAVDEAKRGAVAAADRGLPVILSYDYRSLADDRSAAERLLTPDYRKDFGKAFDLLEKGKDGTAGSAVQTKTVVKAVVVGTAVMDAEPHRVNVLAYVNQTSRHPGKEPVLFQNRVRVPMVERDGVWLIDGLDPR